MGTSPVLHPARCGCPVHAVSAACVLDADNRCTHHDTHHGRWTHYDCGAVLGPLTARDVAWLEQRDLNPDRHLRCTGCGIVVETR